MSEPRNPEPANTFEAFAQVGLAWWEFVEVAFGCFPGMDRYAQQRRSEAFVRAVMHRAKAVGREQAEADYANPEADR